MTGKAVQAGMRQQAARKRGGAAFRLARKLKGRAGKGEASPEQGGERHRGERLLPSAERALQTPAPDLPSEQWLPRRWPYLILAYVLLLASSITFAQAAPDPLTSVLLAVGGLGLLPVHGAYRYARFRPTVNKGLAVLAVVVLPLFLFALGMCRWALIGGISWGTSLAALFCIAGVATVYLRYQPVIIVLALFALALPIIFSHASTPAFVAVGMALAVSVLLGREQIALQRKEARTRRANERVQARARDILSDYEDTGLGWFWEVNRRALLTYVSEPVARMLGVQQDALVGQPLVKLFDLSDTAEEGARRLLFHLSARSAFTELPIRAATPGEERWWSVSGRPLYDQFDNFVGFRGSGTDLTERKRSQEQASRLAHYDSLTGLANRFQMSQSLEKILHSPQESNRCCAVMLLDLDRFKHVNDTLGHPAGDALLKQVGQRLQRAVGEAGQAGRLGGDEFKVVLPKRIARDDLAALSKDIIQALSQPYTIDSQRVVIGASAGIAVAPEDGETSEELIRNADLALYAAKDAGRGRYHFYSEDLHAEAEARSAMEGDLRDAIARRDLRMFYQPVIATATETISGFEALMRWHHPAKGWISPSQFIGIAEDSGQIAQLGEWALRKVCRDMAQWPEEVRVAVNVSPLQFASPLLPEILRSAIEDAAIDPSRLELEFTETVFLVDNSDAMFAALKEIGVRLALDDFGTGYSSLYYLKKAPFDKIKIDQSFVRGATDEGSRNGAIIASITSLADALGMDTTAEGVETMEELNLVRLHGCSHVQGYIYERPLSGEDATARLAAGLHAVARGPRCSRAPRQTIRRKVVLDHQGHLYNGTIRNISTTGALIVGLWNVPAGTIFKVQISQDQSVTCATRWCQDDRMGVEFANPLQRDGAGRIVAIKAAPPRHMLPEELRKAG